MIKIAKFHMFENEQGFLQVDIDIPDRDLMQIATFEPPTPEVRSDLFFTINEILRGLENE